MCWVNRTENRGKTKSRYVLNCGLTVLFASLIYIYIIYIYIGDAQLHTEGWRRRSATHWRPEEMVSYTLKARRDGQLHTEGRRWCLATHWRPEVMLSYTLKAGGDGQLHTEGWRRWSATHWRLEKTVSCLYCAALYTFNSMQQYLQNDASVTSRIINVRDWQRPILIWSRIYIK